MLVVDPAQRGQGISNRLLIHAEHYMVSRGVRASQLYSKMSNRPAHLFYSKRGYAPEAFRFLKRLAG
ncbi:GNAT family N-acetyltransferase [Cyanobium sp. ATX 6A2]|uniref:GNAT family N-acetyltransferase n=1 Tax=Cyanobium sp. ATX 6A2 TaxID=2823700 RepID=UPI0037C06345|nr:GNAT family N-acetyltransferase [Cyanobium sp. ATX 6A2]